MRRIFRWAVAGIFGLLILISGGLAVFTAETVVDEVGYTAMVRRLIREGWRVVNDTGYAYWVFVALIFFAGAMVALWLDYLLRKETTVMIYSEKRIKEHIYGRHYMNEEVILDGYEYNSCDFENVKFI